RLELRLDAPVLALDDFDDPDWSPFGDDGARRSEEAAGPEAPGSEPGATLAGVGEQAARAGHGLQQPLGADTLARLDAQLAIDAASLRAGDVRLGDARLYLSVADGRLRLDPVAATIGDGEFRLVLDYAPLASGGV